MKLYQVRKGQFVYFNNELCRVYSVKPMYKQSVHLIRLRDLKQQLTNAANVERIKPEPLDSFLFNNNIYTLHRDKKASEGDFILITNPNPDYLDHYFLNAIEVVATVESKGVITNKSNGIRHNEYLLMVPGRESGSRPIEYQDIEKVHDSEAISTDQAVSNFNNIEVGDVYRKRNSDTAVEAMVIAIQGETIILGGNLQLPKNELTDHEKWEFLYSLNQD
ncbi:hypothetical protein EV207_105127 [Scopulibacillus darangshiensis]|uniref:Uncharacterized protein n=1 Tax=Scopulibacillus darangshiensis TaxID=442528 RepID=A0A4R2P8G2_9BACL|nr:hypothetical protein [Scopulibacillus darangshiensis]TCP30598.1 hypothetical protein EV207_105127 [Scopulibacillus darangshiensis]